VSGEWFTREKSLDRPNHEDAANLAARNRSSQHQDRKGKRALPVNKATVSASPLDGEFAAVPHRKRTEPGETVAAPLPCVLRFNAWND
jgi:hypothetical protein